MNVPKGYRVWSLSEGRDNLWRAILYTGPIDRVTYTGVGIGTTPENAISIALAADRYDRPLVEYVECYRTDADTLRRAAEARDALTKALTL